MDILLASTNRGKLAELSALFADLPGYRFALGPALEIEETGTTFAQNAMLKAMATRHATGQACLADDSGLAVDALGGRPGVYSARYAENDAARIQKLLGELEGVPMAERGAAFVCAMALVLPSGEAIAVEGRCEGRIALAPRGQGGFGYDPIFEIPELGQTFGELSAEEKHARSHRGKAAWALKQSLSRS